MFDRATILHADLDAFYASVEQRDHPRLRGRPVAVGGGVVLAASYEARAYGVGSAMGEQEARRRCPGLLVVRPRMDAYVAASKAVFAVFADTTPLVEGISIDEAFLDVGGLGRVSGAPADIAAELRRQVRARVDLAVTVGVARTKFLAKVASGVAKPDGLLVVEPAGELAFLHPLPVGRLWGVGPKTAVRLHERGITTVADVARLPESALVAILGPASGRHLAALARHHDPRPVTTGGRRRSVGAQSALGRRRRAPGEIEAVLAGLVDRVSGRLRHAGRVGRTMVLRLRFADYTRATRSRTIPQATASTATLLEAAQGLLADAAPLIAELGITLIGVAITNLDDDHAVQLALPFDGHDRAALDAAVDDVRERFGSGSLRRAALLGRAALGPPAPSLEDGPW